jgi:hypothetical protein
VTLIPTVEKLLAALRLIYAKITKKYNTGDAGKNAKTGFIRWTLACPYRIQCGVKCKISSINMNVSNIVTIKGTIRKI